MAIIVGRLPGNPLDFPASINRLTTIESSRVEPSRAPQFDASKPTGDLGSSDPTREQFLTPPGASVSGPERIVEVITIEMAWFRENLFAKLLRSLHHERAWMTETTQGAAIFLEKKTVRSDERRLRAQPPGACCRNSVDSRSPGGGFGVLIDSRGGGRLVRV
jgi:hypothetical protein